MEEVLTHTRKIAGVRFRDNWKVYDFDASDLDVAVGDRVIVDSERGPGFAHVVRIRRSEVPVAETPPATPALPPEIPEGVEIDIDDVGKELPVEVVSAGGHPHRGARRVLRRATDEDIAREEKNREREREAFLDGQEMISEREFPMKLVRVEYSFDASRATFFFFSETRIDFRELVKDLAHKLKARIEMRQIGVRDVARMIGGFGPCGRELCCSSFLKNFEPVSIRMAKKQEMVLNPAKISGVCGRLLCCLSYEYQVYDEIKKDIADMSEAAAREKKDKNKEDLRVAEERRAEEERRHADEKQHQENRRQQEPRREKRPDGGPKGGGRPEKGREQQERKAQQQAEPARDQAAGKQPEQKAGQQQQAGERTGKRKRRRFWRKKKKGQQGENKPQGPAGPQNQG